MIKSGDAQCVGPLLDFMRSGLFGLNLILVVDFGGFERHSLAHESGGWLFPWLA